MTGATGGAQLVTLCPEPRVAPVGDVKGIKALSLPDSFFSYVIAGLDPAIHVNKFAILLIWIPGSSPGMTVKK